MLEMHLSLRLAQNCTECGRALSKPEDCADQEDVHEVACAAREAEYSLSKTTRVCNKCGQVYYET
jgi:flagellar hook-basal body complex protein FliE